MHFGKSQLSFQTQLAPRAGLVLDSTRGISLVAASTGRRNPAVLHCSIPGLGTAALVACGNAV